LNLQELLNKAEKRLSLIHPELRLKARELIKRAYDKGIYVIVSQGLRTITEQNALYAQGRTAPGKIVTNAKGGTSYHNYGLAFDFAISNSNGTVVYWDTSIDTNKDGAKDWYQVGAIGQQLGLEWGGSWTGFKDIPHFQLTFGLSIKDLQSGKKPPIYKEVANVVKSTEQIAYEKEMTDAIDFLKWKGVITEDRRNEPVSRGQVFLMLYRYYNNVIKPNEK
jgi:peptidoglycan LD-endopeptidase CwlK